MLRLRTIRRVKGARRVVTEAGAFHFDESRGDTACVPEPVAEELVAEGRAYLPSPQELCAGKWIVRRRAGMGDVLCLSAALREVVKFGGAVEVIAHANYRTIFDGFPQGAGQFQHRPVLFDGWLERHPGRRGRPAAACLGDYWNLDLEDMRPYFALSEQERSLGRSYLAQLRGGSERVVALFQRAGWETRTYRHWRQVAKALADSGCTVLGFDGEVLPCCKQPFPMPLRALAGVIAACDLVVTGDSGPLHLAAAVGTPSVSVFCCTGAAGSVGRGYDTESLEPEGMECWPCWAASCRVGEVDVPGSCVEAVSPESVTQAALGRLKALSGHKESADAGLLR